MGYPLKFRKYFDNNMLIIFFIMFSTGLASLLYEVVLISVVVTIVGATEMSVSIILASFLFGLAIGALFGGLIVKKHLPKIQILMFIEIIIALFGFSFLSIISKLVSTGFDRGYLFWIILPSLLIPTMLMGMEIPLAVSILEDKRKKNVTGFVYFSDTLGGVIGALFSGILFIPSLGFHGAMYLGGSLNLFTFLLATRLNKKKNFRFFSIFSILLIILIASLFGSGGFLYRLRLNFLDSFYSVGSAFHSIYYTKTIYSTISPYQHIVILKSPYYGYQLLLDGRVQVSDKESIRYHEYLTLPAIASHPNPEKVLLIGGGDGGVLYQLLKFNFTKIDHVDLDKKVIEVSKRYLYNVHRGALDDKRVNRYIEDGRQFLKNSPSNFYDIIIIDLPDPYYLKLAPLYSKDFYKEVDRVLKKNGVMVTQAQSPYFYLEAYTSIYKTMKSVMPHTYPYVFPGSIGGSLGYIIAGKDADPKVVRNENVEGVWYSTQDHKYLFFLPKFLRKYVKNNDIQISTDENPIIQVYMQNDYYFRGLADKVD